MSIACWTKDLASVRRPAHRYAMPRYPHNIADRKSTRLNSSHLGISYAVFCLKKNNSSRLAKDMTVTNARLGTPLRLSRVSRFFGRDRETLPEAFPGPVVGVVTPGRIAISYTL